MGAMKHLEIGQFVVLSWGTVPGFTKWTEFFHFYRTYIQLIRVITIYYYCVIPMNKPGDQRDDVDSKIGPPVLWTMDTLYNINIYIYTRTYDKSFRKTGGVKAT